MATGVGDIFLDLKLNKQPFEKGLNETKATASLAGRKIGLAIGGAIAGAVGAVGFSALVSSTAKLGDAIDKTSQKMGMSAQAYQEWDFIMQRCGTSMDSMTMAMKTLASSAVTSKDALSELGISQEEVASLSQEQLFARTIQALQNVEDTTRRTYLAGQLLGRGATELGAVLNMSASETDALRQRVYELGGVMSQQAVTASAQYTDAMLDLKMAFRGVSDTVAVTVLPIITSAINKVIIPVILRAVAVVRYFGNIFASMFGGLGKNIKTAFGGKAQKQNISFGKSMGGISKGIGGAGKSAKKAKKAVKELNRELMGFDKINKLSKKQKADAGGGAGGAGGAGGVGGIGDMGEALGGANGKLGIFGKLSEKLRPIWKALGEVFKAVIRLFKAIGKALAPVGKWIWEHLIKPFGKLLGMAIIAVLQGIAGAIDMVASFIEKHPKISVVLMGLGTALLLIIKRGAVIGVLTKIGKAFRVLGGAIMAHPIALLLVAIALAIGYIYKNWNKIKKTKFGKALIKIGNVLKQVGGVMKNIGKLIWKSIVVRFKLMVGAVKLAWAVLKKVGSFFKGTFKKAIEVVSDPLTALKDAWAGIKSKTVDLKAKVEEGVDGLLEVPENVVIGLQAKWESGKEAFENFKNAVGTKFSRALESAWNTGKELFINFKDAVGGVFKRGLESAWNTGKDLFENFKNAVGGAFKRTLSSAWDTTQSVFTSFKDAIGSKFSRTLASAWDTTKATFTGFKDAVGNKFSRTLSSAWDATSTTFTSFKDAVGSKFSRTLSSAWDTTQTTFTSFKDAVGSVFKRGLSSAWETGEALFNSFKDAVGGTITKTLATAKGKWDGKTLKAFNKIKGGTIKKTLATAKGTWNKITDKFSKLSGGKIVKTLSVNVKAGAAKGYNAVVKKLRGSGIAVIKAFGNKLPYPLAQGGWVQKNSPRLAVVGDNRHEAEIVAPDSKLMAMARQASQEAVKNSSNAQVVSLLSQLLIAVQNQNTDVYLDGKAISNNTVKHINQDTRRTGKLAIIL